MSHASGYGGSSVWLYPANQEKLKIRENINIQGLDVSHASGYGELGICSYPANQEKLKIRENIDIQG